MRFAEANGIVLHHAVRDGPAGAPTLVFANSLGTDFRIWTALIERLGAGYRHVVYDKRGHGLSDCPPGPYRIEGLVDDLAALLDHLGVSNAILVGLSVGGMIAQGLAAARPDLVRGLVLSDTAYRIGPRKMWDQRIAAVRDGGIEALAEPILERWFSAAFRAGRPDQLAGLRAMLVRTPLDGYLGTCAALRDADLSAAARGLRVPTLCLCGSEDGATPPDLVRALAELIPGAGFTLIEGPGHLPCIEAPDAMADLMTRFFAEAGLV